MFSIKVDLFFVLLTIFFSIGSTEYKGGAKAAPVIYDGSSISFLNKGEENIKIHPDDWESTDFVQKDVKREVTEDYDEQYGEEYVEPYHPINTQISSWTMLYQWMMVGIFFGMIMGCCFGKITFWTWLSDTRAKRMKRLKRMSRASKLHVSKSAPRSTLLAVEPAMYIVPLPSKTALESKPSLGPPKTALESKSSLVQPKTALESKPSLILSKAALESDTSSPPPASSEEIELEPIAGTSSQL